MGAVWFRRRKSLARGSATGMWERVCVQARAAATAGTKFATLRFHINDG